MEKGIREAFGLEKGDIRGYSPLTLAYLGDAVYDLLIRTLVVEQGNCPPNKLHKKTAGLVKAQSQAELIARIRPWLTSEEEQIYRRGRNAQSHTMAKNATMHDYRMATGLEALTGYLYLEGRTDRLLELVKRGLFQEEAGKEEDTQA